MGICACPYAPCLLSSQLVSPLLLWRSDLGRNSRMFMKHIAQQLSEEGLPKLLWGNSLIFPKTAQQDDTSWPSPRRTECPFMS